MRNMSLSELFYSSRYRYLYEPI